MDPANKTLWQRYLQYSSEKPDHSLITTRTFFLSPDGHTDLEQELEASLTRLRSSEKIPSETGEQPIQCVFPARIEVLKRLGYSDFPKANCPELERWKKAFGGQKVWIIYAGPYRNNPASLFGHTFLRFDKLANADASQALRSQSVGFLADTPAKDSQTQTVFKGLFGFYTGYYNVQPYYMQTALYNNAESRSLWEFELDLTAQEKDFLLTYLWELSERAGMAYWFADENCSFQLLALLEALRPEKTLTQETGLFVLPLETVRILNENGYLKDQKPVYQTSIRSRRNQLIDKMTPEQRHLYREARTDISVLEKIEDRLILDALIENNSFQNYKEKTLLNEKQKKIFDLTLQKRSQLGISETPLEFATPDNSPLESHRPTWVQFSVSGEEIRFESLLGAHDLSSSLKGLEEPSTMEYLGLDVRYNHQGKSWSPLRVLLARARTFNPLTREDLQWSWAVDGFYDRGVETGMSGGGSWYFDGKNGLIAVMAQARHFTDGKVGAGPHMVLRYEAFKQIFALESSKIFFQEGSRSTLKAEWVPLFWGSDEARLRVQWEDHDSVQLGLRQYF